MKAEQNERRRTRSSPFEASGIGHALYAMAFELPHLTPPEAAENAPWERQMPSPRRVEPLARLSPHEVQALTEGAALCVEVEL